MGTCVCPYCGAYSIPDPSLLDDDVVLLEVERERGWRVGRVAPAPPLDPAERERAINSWAYYIGRLKQHKGRARRERALAIMERYLSEEEIAMVLVRAAV